MSHFHNVQWADLEALHSLYCRAANNLTSARQHLIACQTAAADAHRLFIEKLELLHMNVNELQRIIGTTDTPPSTVSRGPRAIRLTEEETTP